MEDRTRAKIAAAVAAASLDTQVTRVIDLEAGHEYRIRAQMTHGRLDGYDYRSERYFKGMSSESLNFYDYETQSHIHLKLIGRIILGYDLKTKTAFNGQAFGRIISLYDYGTRQIYRYTI